MTVGVGSNVTMVFSGKEFLLNCEGPAVFAPSCAVGVGKNEQPFTPMAGANIGRSKSSPFRIPPDFGKVSEDIGKAQSEVTADVLQDRVSGSYCANGVEDVWP